MEIAMSELKNHLLTLSHSERALLANVLLSSLEETESEEQIEALWLDEAERRIKDYESGKIGSLTMKEAFDRAYKELGCRS